MWLYLPTSVLLRPVFRLYWDFDIGGAVGSLPRQGPVLVVANHTSFLDPWFVGMACRRHVSYLMNRRWYERSALWRFFFRAYGTLPADERRLEVTLERVMRRLERGRAVGLFPEGGISPDGAIRRFKSGAALLAARSGAPVVPLGIRGAYESLPRHSRWPRRGRIVIRAGERMAFPGAPVADPPHEKVRRFRDEMFAAVCRLTDQAGDGPR